MADEIVDATNPVVKNEVAAPAVIETKASDLLAGKPDAKPVVEETASEFDIDLDEKVEVAPGSKVKFGKDRFKELDDDISDEDFEFEENTSKILDKVFNRAKEYKEKANSYKTIAEANQTVQTDPHIKTWATAHDLPDDKLILEVEKAKYEKAGYSEDEALTMATADVTELKEESEKLFAKKAKDVRLELRSAIQTRSQEIQANISKTAEALSLSNAPNPELITKTIESLSKVDNFLGLKIGGKNEQSRKDFIKPVADGIKDGSLLKKLQSDPELLSEFGLYVQYKDKFKTAIEKRTPTKQKMVQQLSNAPHSNGRPAITSDIVVGQGSGLKNPGSFV